MAGSRTAAILRAKAFAKINLTLRVLGVRPDGYHDLRTTFQSIALHDTLAFTRVGAEPFRIECDDPRCPVDRRNLIWRAAEHVWRASGRRGQPSGVAVRLVKRIPIQAGLGGGSSDAAAALRAFGRLWGVSDAALGSLAAALGADVPFFLEGGTALGVERGDLVIPLAPLAPRADRTSPSVVLVVPPFSVSTADAYRWWDESAATADTRDRVSALEAERQVIRGWGAGIEPRAEARARVKRVGRPSANDLEAPVVVRHPEIRQIIRTLQGAGASHAAMSGSGSTVFGVFENRVRADTVARRLAGRNRLTIVTKTLGRSRYQSLARVR